VAAVTLAVLGAMPGRISQLEASSAVVPTMQPSVRRQVPQSSGDQARLEEISAEISRGIVRIDRLQAIPVAARSTELQQLVAELTASRDELHVLRDRFADDYPAIQALLGRIGTIERQEILQVVQSLIESLRQA
jgi:hypothetical protein